MTGHRENSYLSVLLWLSHSGWVKSIGEREVVPLGVVNHIHLGEGLGVKK